MSFSALFAIFSACCCLRMLLLKRRRRIKKGAIHSDLKQGAVPCTLPLPSATPSSLHNTSSSCKLNDAIMFVFFSITLLLFARFLLQMTTTCVNLSVFFEFSLFHEITRTKYKKVLIFSLRYFMK